MCRLGLVVLVVFFVFFIFHFSYFRFYTFLSLFCCFVVASSMGLYLSGNREINMMTMMMMFLNSYKTYGASKNTIRTTVFYSLTYYISIYTKATVSADITACDNA